MRKTILLLLLVVISMPTHSVSWQEVSPDGKIVIFNDFSGVTWAPDQGGQVCPYCEVIILQRRDLKSDLQCANQYVREPFTCRFQTARNDCVTLEDAIRTLDLYLGARFARDIHTPMGGSTYTFVFTCGSPKTGVRWTGQWRGEDSPPSPPSCVATDAEVRVKTRAGETGVGDTTFTVTCSRASDVVLSIPSDTVILTNGGSVKLSLNDQGPRTTLKGVTSAVVNVSGRVTDTQLAAGVYIGSTVVTLEPL